MAILRRTAMWGGSLAVGAVVSVAASQAALAADEPQPAEAEKPAVKIEQTAPSAAPRSFGPAVAPAAPCAACGQAAAVPAYGQAMVGEYRVGHIHEPLTSHIFHDTGWNGYYPTHSFFNPYMQEVHAPFRRTVFRGQIEPYYTRYRSLYVPNFDTFYVPQPAPNAYTYGGSPSGTYQANYGPAGAAPGFPTYLPNYAPPAPESAAYVGTDPARTGSPGFFAPYGYAPNSPANAGAGPYPYGNGSGAYFGAYGPRGW